MQIKQINNTNPVQSHCFLFEVTPCLQYLVLVAFGCAPPLTGAADQVPSLAHLSPRCLAVDFCTERDFRLCFQFQESPDI